MNGNGQLCEGPLRRVKVIQRIEWSLWLEWQYQQGIEEGIEIRPIASIDQLPFHT